LPRPPLQPAWRHADGTWQPAFANFTSLATPNELGSGKTALVTLLHEGGHGGLGAVGLGSSCFRRCY
jgi:hypothetical protein